MAARDKSQSGFLKDLKRTSVVYAELSLRHTLKVRPTRSTLINKNMLCRYRPDLYRSVIM